jgi:hypothetical protein
MLPVDPLICYLSLATTIGFLRYRYRFRPLLHYQIYHTIIANPGYSRCRTNVSNTLYGNVFSFTHSTPRAGASITKVRALPGSYDAKSVVSNDPSILNGSGRFKNIPLALTLLVTAIASTTSPELTSAEVVKSSGDAFECGVTFYTVIAEITVVTAAV